MRVRLGAAVFDSEARCLVRNGADVPLSPKAFRLLEILLDRRPKAVSKADLQEELWPSTFVSEGNLSVLMAEVRKALGDGARDSRFIRTVHGFGYAFREDAEGAVAAPVGKRSFYVRVAGQGRATALREGRNVLGRDPECEVPVDRATVSRHHARIEVRRERATLEDLDSKNGTFHRGRRLSGPAELEDGDEIGLGSVVLRFFHRDGLDSTRTEGPGSDT